MNVNIDNEDLSAIEKINQDTNVTVHLYIGPWFEGHRPSSQITDLEKVSSCEGSFLCNFRSSGPDVDESPGKADEA